MRSPEVWLLRKEIRELAVSRAFWLLLLVMGPLTGVSFISAASTYAEVSGMNGTTAGVGEALSPLTGVWAPTFSACELAAVFLLPFVAIRVVAGDQQSGALKLELQRGLSPLLRVGIKAAVVLAGWLLAMIPALLSVLLWKSYGGAMYAPELATVIAGHILNAALTIGLAFAAAALTEHPSTAAILTLSLTVGTWIVSFFAAVQGGFWERIATFTPAAIVADFQHGLLQLNSVLIAGCLSVTGLALAALWQRPGIQSAKRSAHSLLLVLAAAIGIYGCSFLHANWDLSESRANSFSRVEEQALRGIHDPLRIVVHLAPEDPRRVDLEHRALLKLRRVLPGVDIQYVSASSIGLFEQATAGYGEVWYYLRGRSQMSRATTAESVLESIYSLAGIEPTGAPDEPFRGHPLATPPTGAAALFYLAWPAAILLAGLAVRKKLSSS